MAMSITDISFIITVLTMPSTSGDIGDGVDSSTPTTVISNNADYGAEKITWEANVCRFGPRSCVSRDGANAEYNIIAFTRHTILAGAMDMCRMQRFRRNWPSRRRRIGPCSGRSWNGHGKHIIFEEKSAIKNAELVKNLADDGHVVISAFGLGIKD